MRDIHYSINENAVCGKIDYFDINDKIKNVTCFSCLKEIFPEYTFDYNVSKDKPGRKNFSIYHLQDKIANVDFIVSTSSFPSFIQNLWVHSKYRNKGLATIMMRKIMSIEDPPIQLKAEPYGEDKENSLEEDRLILFYKNLGFEKVPINKNMIWYPTIEGKIKISITRNGIFYISKIENFDFLSGFGETLNESIGDLVSRHSNLFNVNMVRNY